MSQIITLDSAYLHTTPGIYAFLGLATLPRFRTQANLLRLIPREIIDRIARFAHRDAFLAAWHTGDEYGRLSTVSDITELNHEEAVTLYMERPLRMGVNYIEVTTSAAWYGTRLTFGGVGMADFGLHLNFDEDFPTGPKDICLIREYGRILKIKSLGNDSWTWCSPVTFGVLVDMNRGCVTFRLNGIDGPCVRFPGSYWKSSDGAWIKISEFPADEVHQETGEPLLVVVACATPPVPPSLLEAAANPLTASEHVAAGAFEDITDLYT